MKVMLMQPPFRYLSGSARPSVSFPLGLLYIAAVLEENDHEVCVYDASLNAQRPMRPGADDSTYMGDSWKEVEEKVAGCNPDIVGITCSFTSQWDNAVTAAQIVKKVRDDILVVVGGNHATARPADFFQKTGSVDVVCSGEGEYTMLDIVKKFSNREDLSGIAGTVLRDGDKIKANQPRPLVADLDRLPFPAYHLIDLESYFSLYKQGFTGRPRVDYPGSERAMSVITSRGCPFNCVFCSVHLHMGRKWRCHSADHVLKHLQLLADEYGVRHIHFEDDNLTCRGERFSAILDGLKERNIPLTWDTPNGVRVDTFTADIIRKCADSGCVYLIFGVESGNEYVLENIIDKRLDLKKVAEVSSLCRKACIDTAAFFVIGFPGETRQQMLDTVAFAGRLHRQHDVVPGIFVATPLPGTRLEKLWLERGIMKSGLSAQDMARMTQGEFLQDGDTFQAGDVRDALALFYRNYKRTFIMNALRFFLRHPGAFIVFMTRLVRRSRFSKQALLDDLQYKYFLCRL